MKIDNRFKIRKVANENILIIPGKSEHEKTQIIALNETALILWNALKGRDFTLEDATTILTDHFEVSPETAQKDVSQWIALLAEHQIILT